MIVKRNATTFGYNSFWHIFLLVFPRVTIHVTDTNSKLKIWHGLQINMTHTNFELEIQHELDIDVGHTNRTI